MPFVLDASVTLAWCFRDEGSPYAYSIRDALVGDSAIVPGFWNLEVSNGLRVGERRGRASEAEVTEAVEFLLALPIIPVEIDAQSAMRDVLNLAKRHGQTVYDAAYLYLAMSRGLHLATQDDDLLRALEATGVPLFDPR